MSTSKQSRHFRSRHFVTVVITGIDVLGEDIVGVDILEIDITALPLNRYINDTTIHFNSSRIQYSTNVLRYRSIAPY